MIEITATGNVGADATIIQVSKEKKGIKFSIADNEKWTGADGQKYEKSTWLNCVKWVNTNENTKLTDYLKKGARVMVKGKPKIDQYTTKSGEAAATFAIDVHFIEIQKFADVPQQQQ